MDEMVKVGIIVFGGGIDEAHYIAEAQVKGYVVKVKDTYAEIWIEKLLI